MFRQKMWLELDKYDESVEFIGISKDGYKKLYLVDGVEYRMYVLGIMNNWFIANVPQPELEKFKEEICQGK